VSPAAPTDDELAAIALVLASVATTSEVPEGPGPSAWQLAARRPDLEYDELLALRNACSTRF
jgi:hypothetical protein